MPSKTDHSLDFLIAMVFTLFLGFCANARGSSRGQDEARDQFDQGRKLFNKGRFEQAAVALRRAYELRPSYKILYFIGWAEIENEAYAMALDVFRRYLEQGGDDIEPKKKREVSREIEKLQASVGVIEVQSAIEEAHVTVDGERRATTPVAEGLLVDLGTHEVVVHKEGEELHRETVRVAGGQRVRIQVPVDSTQQKLFELGIHKDKLTPGERYRLWTWIAIGIGGAAGITGIITGAVAVSRAKDVDASCNGDVCPLHLKDDAKEIERLGWATNVLLGVAVAGVVTGTLLYFFAPDQEKQQTAGLRPFFGPDAGGLIVTCEF